MHTDGRLHTQLVLSRAQRTFQSKCTCESKEQHLQEISTEDDVMRAYGVLLAFSKYGDHILLFANAVCQDTWLQQRASQNWWQTKLIL